MMTLGMRIAAGHRHWLLIAVLGLSACGGGGGGSTGAPPVEMPPPATYTVGGAVTGLRGSGLVLQLGGANNLAVAADGTFTFPTSVNAGTNYTVSVFVQPSSPVQSCTVAAGTGTVQANVTSVQVTCVAVPLTLMSAAPIAGATGVSRDIEPRLAFSAPLNVATLNQAQVSLEAPGLAPMQLTTSVNAQELLLSPAEALWPATEFQLTVSGLEGALGEVLNAPVALSFMTRDGEWRREPSPAYEEVETLNMDSVQVAVGRDGRSLSAWAMTAVGESGERIRANSFGTSGQTEVIFTSEPFLAIESLDAAIAADGTAYLVWSAAFTGGRLRVLLTYREAGASQWSTPLTLSRDSDLSNLEPRIAAGANGGIYVVWKGGSSPYRIVAAHGEASAWSEPFTVNEGTQDVFGPAVIVDGSMRAHIAWHELVGSHHELKSRRHLATAGQPGWLGPVDDVMPGRAASAFRLAGNAAGAAAIVLRDNTAAPGEYLWAAVFAPDSGWGPAASLEEGGSTFGFDGDIAVDPAGAVTAIWVALYQGIEYQVLSRTLPAPGPGTVPQWSALHLHDQGITPRIAFDDRGHGIALWNYSTEEIKASRFLLGGGWSVPAFLAQEPPGGVLALPQFGFDATGSAIALWLQLDFLNSYPNQGFGQRPGMARFY
jgi:Bacterial Ig-like domain